MNKLKCPICGLEIDNGDNIVNCPSCGIMYHERCWIKNRGCTTFNCKYYSDFSIIEQEKANNFTEIERKINDMPVDSELNVVPAEDKISYENKKLYCVKCGEELNEMQAFCPKCGAANISQKNYCKNCGAEMEKEQTFCSACGTKSTLEITPEKVDKEQKKKKIIFSSIAAGAALLIVAIVLIIVFVTRDKVSVTGDNGKDFNKMFAEIKFNSWCEIAEDGSWMRIDTNPYDIDSDEFDYSYYLYVYNPCSEKIKEVNLQLGFSSALYAKMGETTFIQGRQTQSNDKYTVSWTYHPDKGLEILYEVN